MSSWRSMAEVLDAQERREADFTARIYPDPAVWHVCACGRSFETKIGLAKHETQAHGPVVLRGFTKAGR